MRASYRDIHALTDANPKWHDWHGVPRYCDFAPEHASNIYAHEVCLLKIRCQSCHKPFHVEMHSDRAKDMMAGRQHVSLADRIRNRTIHYGDPPRHYCGGDTMNSEPDRVLGFWHRPQPFEWERVPELEISVEDDD